SASRSTRPSKSRAERRWDCASEPKRGSRLAGLDSMTIVTVAGSGDGAWEQDERRRKEKNKSEKLRRVHPDRVGVNAERRVRREEKRERFLTSRTPFPPAAGRRNDGLW